MKKLGSASCFTLTLVSRIYTRFVSGLIEIQQHLFFRAYVGIFHR